MKAFSGSAHADRTDQSSGQAASMISKAAQRDLTDVPLIIERFKQDLRSSCLDFALGWLFGRCRSCAELFLRVSLQTQISQPLGLQIAIASPLVDDFVCRLCRGVDLLGPRAGLGLHFCLFHE
jgi:hypothetical protein